MNHQIEKDVQNKTIEQALDKPHFQHLFVKIDTIRKKKTQLLRATKSPQWEKCFGFEPTPGQFRLLEVPNNNFETFKLLLPGRGEIWHI